MKTAFYLGAATAALIAGGAQADQITVAGPWLSPEQEVVREIFDVFEERTGHEVSYVGSDSFEQQIVVDAEAGAAPNLAVFPQPGLAADLASRGFLTPLKPDMSAWVKDNYAAGQSWVDLGSFADKNGDSQHYGMFFRVDLKSLVWYSPENFEDAGYEIPESMEDLKALTEQMVADGVTPWCIGLGSGAATGWPATDWVEDLMLRTQSPADYDAWVANDMKFNDPKVIEAIEEFGWFIQDANVAGGTGAVATTDFRDSPKGLFSSPPQCMMHRQASFIPAFFPEGTEVGVDADFFYFPSYADKDLGNPVLGAGTLFAITNESDAAHELIAFLQEPIAHEIWMSKGGFLTPHKGVDTSKFVDDTSRKMNEILLGATTFRFDGSDLMPGGVGAGSFWTGMVDYTGGKSAEEVTTEIQNSWDALK
ncbi:ABC transporter substrate-binding protein [Tropicibacter naphthalenivorans]|uniref:Maltose-binding periplasmic proteins/domains n=1 Tax=Tropicibacter naphthalenivorans TaxID=441103 RepID=A0A0P1GMC3_9RHOB|nr:ABC transporter substrate-binding protein [Tropicibacter naphthalenivorans]CUH77078.1 Maltose-binding periplasmic proteins/domains [Tropicibacter naphthalenivorans]SMC60877.1 maltose-binding protein /trehalose-binding protein /sucrose-binding protein [Tropicibacter naphthalenivorans]